MEEEVFRRDDRKASLGKSWEEEVQHLTGEFYEAFISPETQAMMLKFKNKYSRDPHVQDFYRKYQTVVGILSHIKETKVPDPLEKLTFIASYLGEQHIKDISAFVYSTLEVNKKYELFNEKLRWRKNNLAPKQSAELNRSLSPLFQWLPKIQLHLAGKKGVEQLAERFNEMSVIFNAETKRQDLEALFRDKGPDPFRSLFRKTNNAALNRIHACKTNDIADFLLAHPDYADAFLKKPRRDGRNFLNEFYADPASLRKMVVGSTVLRDKINAAYHFWPATKPFPVEVVSHALSPDACAAHLHKVVMPKALRDVLINKIHAAHDNGVKLPDENTMQSFAKNLGDALKSNEGITFKKYEGLLKTDQMNAVFNLDADFFKRNGNAFKAPARPAPAPRVNSNHRPSTH